jgi:hypothetical protein
MAHLKFYLLGLFTFLLSGWELFVAIVSGQFNMLHSLFLSFGLIGATLCILGKLPHVAKWSLTIFYFLQLVFIYSESFSMKFVAGFALPVHYFLRNHNGLEQTISHPTGLGLNLFALIMLLVLRKIYQDKTVT